MKIHLLAIGQKMPSWVDVGYQYYAKRLPAECALILNEIPAAKRPARADITRLLAKEGESILSRLPKAAYVVAMNVDGKAYSTPQLADRLRVWQHLGRDLAILIGGPEGLDARCQKRANESWSLSMLTLPHPMVRVIVAESLYRAWTVLAHHPYHRGH